MHSVTIILTKRNLTKCVLVLHFNGALKAALGGKIHNPTVRQPTEIVETRPAECPEEAWIVVWRQVRLYL